MSGLLPADQFFNALSVLKLVSVDLILENEEGDYLLGYRKNKPAQNTWFVPGGVLRKPESVHQALARVCETELGIKCDRATFFGVAQHSYSDNFLGKDGVSSEYVILAYHMMLKKEETLRLDTQHDEVRWWSKRDLLQSSEVHECTKAYFQEKKTIGNDSIMLYRV